MFDIQELDDMVCSLLEPQDLAQCARVNKKWHTVLTPYLWKDLSCLNDASDTQRQAFTMLIVEDYLHTQQHAKSQEDDPDTEQLAQAQPLSPSALAKYGCWIQTLPDPERLVQLSDDSIQQAQILQGQDKGSTEKDLLLHFLRRCHSAQLSHYFLNYALESGNIKETIAQLVLPRVRHLSVRASYSGKRGELWKLKRLLGRCSTTLEKLTLEIDYKYSSHWSTYEGYDADFKAEEDAPDTTSSTEWSSLKELVLCPRECVGTLQPTTFWSWFYKRCGQVESLEVSKFRRGAAGGIAKNMLEYMPNLNSITIGDGTRNYSTIKPDRVVSLLSGSRNGWKAIAFEAPVNFMNRSRGAIRMHFPTLEMLRTTRAGYSDSELAEILSSCPNLHTFHGIAGRIGMKHSTFIDQDPDTGVLKPWLCEIPLKVLKIDIRRIPRPDLKEDGVVEEETHLGQGREIQGHVYDRLARFANLEILSLGEIPKETIYGKTLWTQFDCLEMSLESGLHKLSGLKKLKELNVLGMKTRIGVKEVQWMTEHWPRLCVLSGLDESDDEAKEAVQWLQEHHPEIELMRAPQLAP